MKSAPAGLPWTLLSVSVRALQLRDAPVAQLDRASDYGSGGWEFESSRARQFILSPETQVKSILPCARSAVRAGQIAGFDKQI